MRRIPDLARMTQEERDALLAIDNDRDAPNRFWARWGVVILVLSVTGAAVGHVLGLR